MNAKLLFVFFAGLLSLTASAKQPMSAVSLSSAQTLEVLDGALPPIPASLDSYESDNCPGGRADRAIVARLSTNETLWGLCKSVSGSDVYYVFFIADEVRARPVNFPVPAGSPSLHSILRNPGIGNEDRVLGSYIQGTGEECDTLGEWIWDGSQFRLLTYRKQTDCKDYNYY